MQYLLLALLTAVVSYWAVLFWQSQVPKVPHIEHTVSESLEIAQQPFELESPAQAIPAQVRQSSGSATISKRGALEPRPLTNDDALVDGESLTSELDSGVALTIPDLATVAVPEDSGITIIQALRDSYLIALDGVLYLETEPEQTVWVRSQGVLVEVSGATARIQSRPEEGFVQVRVAQGTVPVSFLNTNLETEVYTVSQGTIGTVEDAAFTNQETESDSADTDEATD